MGQAGATVATVDSRHLLPLPAEWVWERSARQRTMQQCHAAPSATRSAHRCPSPARPPAAAHLIRKCGRLPRRRGRSVQLAHHRPWRCGRLTAEVTVARARAASISVASLDMAMPSGACVQSSVPSSGRPTSRRVRRLRAHVERVRRCGCLVAHCLGQERLRGMPPPACRDGSSSVGQAGASLRAHSTAQRRARRE